MLDPLSGGVYDHRPGRAYPGRHLSALNQLGGPTALGRIDASTEVGISPSAKSIVPLILGMLLWPLGTFGQEPDTADTDFPRPIEVHTASDLTRSAQLDFIDTMRRLVPSMWVPQVQLEELSSGLRPFQLRGLSPDYTLVRINGVRRHSMAALHGTGGSRFSSSRFMPGASGVDLNAIPRLALEQVEVQKGGTTARYGSGAVAGVLDLRLRSGASPLTVEVHTGKHFPRWFDDDGWKGRMAANGGFEVPGLGGTLNLTGEYLRRTPTSRAGPSDRDQLRERDGDVLEQLDDDPLLDIAEKRNPVPQPTFQIADGFYENRMAWANYERPIRADAELYLWGGWSDRTDRNFGIFRRALEPRNLPEIYPMGFLPTFDVDTRDVQVTGGARGGWGRWDYHAFASVGRNRIDAGITNTFNTTLGPCLSIPCAPGEDGELGTDDDPGIPNQRSFFLGSLESGEELAGVEVRRRFESAPGGPLSLSLGAEVRGETYGIESGEPASYARGWHPNQYGGRSRARAQGFPGWRPRNVRDDRRTSATVHAVVESRPLEDLRSTAAVRLAAYEGIGTLGAADVGASYRFGPELGVDLSAGLGYRIPSLASAGWNHTQTAFFGTIGPSELIGGEFAVDSPAARALGGRPLYEEWARHLAGGVEVGPLDGLEVSVRGYFTRIVDGVILSDPLGGSEVRELLESAGQDSVAWLRYSDNLLDVDSYGADIRAAYRAPFGEDHSVRLAARLHVNRVAVQDVHPPYDPSTGLDEWVEPGTIDRIEHGRPSETGTLSAEYRWRGLEIAVDGVYYGETSCVARCTFGQDAQGKPSDTLATWPAKAMLDAEIGYRFDNALELSIGAQNVTDVMPEPRPSLLHGDSPDSFDNISWPGSPYPWMNGRYLYVSTRWTLD